MIDYSIINDSVQYYSTWKFTRIEVPWSVTPAISAITKPATCKDNTIAESGKCLVASAEQSFLYMMIKGFLPDGRYQAVSPCFRDEQFDTMHSKYFMKNELIVVGETHENTLQFLLSHALVFFKQYLPQSEIISTPEGYDIVCGQYELGSYGIREYEYLKWIYGTGVAEPRLSNVIKTYNGIS